jgi:hypothetical protein
MSQTTTMMTTMTARAIFGALADLVKKARNSCLFEALPGPQWRLKIVKGGIK